MDKIKSKGIETIQVRSVECDVYCCVMIDWIGIGNVFRHCIFEM
jgi:hypothetical protein